MAQQEEGWPLGLRLLNARIGLVRDGGFSRSVSLSTMLTGSPTSSICSSSDLETESTGTGSFFHDRSITLGSLIRISSFLELSRRSTRRRIAEPSKEKGNHKMKPWLFSLCSNLTTDAVIMKDVPSLGHYLEAERRAGSAYRRNQCNNIYGPNDFSPIQDTNSLFVGGQVVPQSSTSFGEDGGKESNRALLEHGDGCGTPVVFPCLCG